ncbi:FAD-dependent thymidylate synthase [Hazenella coriacea]|uniref:Thymidylate synthase Thy1 n=1 Tax=Hazenella coriacea TaxID=1179467 RepID=A0A4R3LA06_9BACL|nr:FAD-dependent thymidylate synthase [Hazenella coriacea]TCS96941.1 thymidylate synthase Thy1 [Hazenella coriacea]
MSTTEIDLTKYVSNLDKNVYTIFNLPEEVIAVIFAYVSRSSASFRENLAKLLADDELGVQKQNDGLATANSEKAARFHEKWVVGYGHSSVAEHAVAHIGIEKISRLASAELELANSFNSFTEYSQRYQRPKRGDFYIPTLLEEKPKLKEAYLRLHHLAYDTYEQLMEGLIPYLQQTLPKQPDETERRYQARIEKIAFEDARYVLTLSTLTNLGMTGNGRALRDTLVRLLSSPHHESQQLAKDLEQEINQVIPTLLRHVKPNKYLVTTRQRLESRWKHIQVRTQPVTGPSARWITLPNYDQALKDIALTLFIQIRSLTYEHAKDIIDSLTLEELEKITQESLSNLQFFDNPMDEFQHLIYRMELKVSEANWHQLLRHNRRTAFSFGQPTIHLGFTIPPHIQAAGLEKCLTSFIEEAETIHQIIEEWNPIIAQYCVTNAHHRQVIATASLWELYHLINLRTSPEAQWDIRATFEQLYKQLQKEHPALISFAQRRLES